MDSGTMLEAIKKYVVDERVRMNILTVDTLSKSEPSGYAFDEFALLLDRQLLTTIEGHGGWHSLEDPEILDGVYRLVVRRTGADAVA